MSVPCPLTAPIDTYEDALHFLDSRDVFSIKLGLTRIQQVLSTLNNPQDALPMVHIAGTNGKGSVTAMLASVLKTAGYTVGTFTSPHLIHVRERIAINGNPILQDDFQFEVKALKLHLETLDWPQDNWPTYFEYLNIMAYQYFNRKQVDITLFETGLGGRLDSTNVVKQPNLTVITTIGMDHMQQLGNSLDQIAAEKAGILKEGVPLVVGGNLPTEALEVIEAKAQALDVPVFKANSEFLQVNPNSTPQTGLQVDHVSTGNRYQLSLLGPYQVENLAIVLTCITQLRQQGYVIEELAIQKSLSHTYWPVRFQYFAAEHLILDGSHNADGFQSLAQSLALYFKDQPIIWLISLRANRNPEALLALMNRFAPPVGVIITQANPSGLYHTGDSLAKMIQAHLNAPCPIKIAETPTQALEELKLWQAQHANTPPLGLVTGSLYTAGEILQRLNHASD